MRKSLWWKWSLLAVVVLVCVGVAGYLRSHLYQTPLETLKQLASAASETMIAGLIDSEIAGVNADTSVKSVLFGKHAGELGESTKPLGPPAPLATQAALPAAEKVSVEAAPEPSADSGVKPVAASLTDRKVVFIYHTHNRESWLPELAGTTKDKPNEAFDAKKNVIMLGERLQKKLEENGVGAVHSGKDYQSSIPSFNYNYSYTYSNKTVREAMAVYSGIAYLFDVHRDASPRKNTTITIGGKDYAKLYFIIGKGNPHWSDNEAFAQQIHEDLNKMLPGVSKGILNKGTKHGHGEYNQSLSSSSVLIEVGGYGNTLEESNRTIDALAKVIAHIVQSAKKADAPSQAQVASAADPS